MARSAAGWRPDPWLGAALALRVAATLLAVGLGFFAVSDDDFARVAIAQEFAEHPAVDPSGSSWLPFPFWLNGSAMLALGRQFWVARAVAVISSLLSVGMVWQSARWCGLSRFCAGLAASLAAVLPHAVWLGYATVPEGLCAAMTLLAAASAAQGDGRARWIGALAMGCAALSRYETWAVAGLLATVNLVDAVKERRAGLLGPSALCALGPCHWMLHGALNHDDALFFIARVADYRRMLGRSPESLWSGLWGYPAVLLRAEPELMAAALSSIAVTWRHKAVSRGALRVGACVAALLGFLIVGDLGDGAPTHHPERPLLFAWLALCVACGATLPRVWQERRRFGYAIAALIVLLTATRTMYTRRDSFIDRRAEIAFGEQVRTHVPAPERLLIDIGDYGYFAIINGFQAPSRAAGVADNDPRQSKLSARNAQERLSQRAAEARAQFAVVKPDQLAELAPIVETVTRTDEFALVRLRP